jgi:hypothetical protein
VPPSTRDFKGHESRNVDRFCTYQGQVRFAHFAGKYFCMA